MKGRVVPWPDDYNFEVQKEQWSYPPIGARNSTSTKEFCVLSDEQVRKFVGSAWSPQYSQPSNWNNQYFEQFKFEQTSGKRVIDFGCGFGFDSLIYARSGNIVSVADIRMDNILAASRVLEAYGFVPEQKILVTNDPPFFQASPVDIFHVSGVLHHTPNAVALLRRAAETLLPGGEIRAMLYTDYLFRTMTGCDPGPIEADITKHPAFRTYVQRCDGVGYYADWYNPYKLMYLVNDFLELISWEYLRPDKGNAVAILRPRKL